ARIVQGASGDAAAARLAGAQRGVVARRQLAAIGVSRGAIQTRRARGTLHALHPAVFAVGHTAAIEGRHEFAGVLACGTTAFLTHWSAAAWYGLWRGWNGAVHVTARGNLAAREGVALHRARNVDARDVRIVRNLPVATPARLLLDLAEVADDRALEQVAGAAAVQDLLRPADLVDLRDRSPGRRGLGRLDTLIDALTRPAFTRSEAEERMLALVREAGLPRPEVNARVAGLEVDFLWRAQHLVVEVDGYAFHAARDDFERDRRRDASLQRAGYRVIRISWRRLGAEPLGVVAGLAPLLLAQTA
ncbi:MAG TPA: DUF559 domain-containing protein, partial [Solirubrobacteraceae bacterium]|nr:DUF559 domain-containing protein [Solirubrobacteraceae bacterium]